jgi:ketosteroid isomerase-like protein
MIRKLSLCASLFLVAIGGLGTAHSAPSASHTLEETVAARSRAFAQAALTGDLATFSSFMPDDYIMLWPEPATDGNKPHWVTKTKAEWVQELSTRKNTYRSVELHNLKVYLHGDVATVTGDYTQTGTRDGADYSDAGLFNETWVRRSGQWVIVGSVFPA